MGLCKQALDQNGGDMEKAIEWLRSQNTKMGVKREGNETAEGRIGVSFDNAAKVGRDRRNALRERPVGQERPVHRAGQRPRQARRVKSKAADVPAMLAEPFGGKGTVQDRINDVVGVIREKMILHKFQRLEGGVYGGYVHHDGTVGVLVECKGGAANDELLKDVAAHIAALNPPYTTTADVPADVLEKEKALVKADIDADPKNVGKPANILEKIAEGKLRTKLAEIVLTEQPMANNMKYPNTTRRRGPQEGRAGTGAVRPIQGRRRDVLTFGGWLGRPLRSNNSGRHSRLYFLKPRSTDAPHTQRRKRLRKSEKRRRQNRTAAKKIKTQRKAAETALLGGRRGQDRRPSSRPRRRCSTAPPVRATSTRTRPPD